MKRPDNIPDKGSENEIRVGTENGSGTGSDSGSGSGLGLGLETGTESRSRIHVIIRFITFGILCLISIAVMALVIWINIRSRLN